MTDLQRQYQGFINTPSLFKTPIESISPYELPIQRVSLNIRIANKLLLGKKMERFFEHYISQLAHCSVVLKNRQIANKNITIGELDFIIKEHDVFKHIELVYKFYLYRPTQKIAQISSWIGPNNKDSLVKKITKLKEKQLPLLYASETQPILKDLNIPVEEIKQFTCFKAQLFTPWNSSTAHFELINPEAIVGYWIPFNALSAAHQTGTVYYIPLKENWVIEAYTQVAWMNYETYIKVLNSYLEAKRAPLCWAKSKKGAMRKFFVVWW